MRQPSIECQGDQSVCDCARRTTSNERDELGPADRRRRRTIRWSNYAGRNYAIHSDQGAARIGISVTEQVLSERFCLKRRTDKNKRAETPICASACERPLPRKGSYERPRLSTSLHRSTASLLRISAGAPCLLLLYFRDVTSASETSRRLSFSPVPTARFRYSNSPISARRRTSSARSM